MDHVLTGFGFGPVQAGLFVHEAAGSGNFSRIVAAEVDRELVRAVRDNKGACCVNIAGAGGIETSTIAGIEMLNPTVPADRRELVDALSQSTEIVTCLPSVRSYGAGGDGSAASLIARGLERSSTPATIIYAAENNNRAAEILKDAVEGNRGDSITHPVQYLNTVIGKMCRLVTDPEEISRTGLAPVAPGADKAFLVEEFNRILVTRAGIPGFTPGMEVLIEKDDLLPFEEAKLYGHNAIQALLAYLGALKGYTRMTELRDDRRIMEIARKAFLAESGAALRKRHHAVKDPLFTERGYEAYALDLLERMTSPVLDDTIERTGRDPVRKLGRTDRLFGTMSLALEHGIRPVNMSLGAAAAIAVLLAGAERYKVPRRLQCDHWQSMDDVRIAEIIEWLWPDAASERSRDLIRHVQAARPRLAGL